MARSTYIYIVLGEDGFPRRAFTVKHELVNYLRRLSFSDVERLVGVLRLHDGGFEDTVVELDVEELLA